MYKIGEFTVQKAKIKFQFGTHLVTVKTHKRLGKVARLPGWGWYQVDSKCYAYKACGMQLPKN